MRVLTLTTLYPNAAAPAHGVFVENRLRDFVHATGADLQVVAPIPWFPLPWDVFGKYGAFARAPRAETRHGIEISHPRYVIPPKVGMTYAPFALARCFMKAAQRAIKNEGGVDIIDAHYLYPDGVAAVHVARKLGLPVVITARGSDVSQIADFPRQRQMILDAVRQADAIICVAAALKDRLVELGAPAEKLIVLRNGVDLETFALKDRDAARAQFNVKGKTVAAVGHLIERKGCRLVIEALAGRPDTTLLIAGDGPERAELEALAKARGVDARFLGVFPHAELVDVYNAADCLALASEREGWPNVLLEAMACGTPVAAAPIWGCKEIVKAPEAGVLAETRSVNGMRQAIYALLDAPPSRAATRGYAENFSWRETSNGLETLFTDIIDAHKRARTVRQSPLPRRAFQTRPKLLVTVDTEEIFDWSSFEPDAHRVAPPEDIDRFQKICAEAGARPLYFLTYPLLTDEKTVAYFKALKSAGAADCGLHLHQWTTPPIKGFSGEYYSWQCNLPNAVYEEKLSALADAYEAAFGERARAHRAGRYGIARGAYSALYSVGVRHDFSPSPAFDFSAAGGPDFAEMSNRAFIVAPPDGDEIIVTPAPGARALRGFSYFLNQKGRIGFSKKPAPTRLSSAVWSPPPLTAAMRLSPEGARLEDLVSLAKRLSLDDAPVLTLSLHSTTLTLGANSYGSSPAAIDQFLETTQRFLNVFAAEIGDIIAYEDLGGVYRALSYDAPTAPKSSGGGASPGAAL